MKEFKNELKSNKAHVKDQWTSKSPGYDQRSGDSISVGDRHGVGKRQPVGKGSASSKPAIPQRAKSFSPDEVV